MDDKSLNDARNALTRAMGALLDPSPENVAVALLHTTVALSRLAQQDAILLLHGALCDARREPIAAETAPGAGGKRRT